MAFFHHLGITRDDAHACFKCCLRHGIDDVDYSSNGKPLFNDEARGQIQWSGTANGYVVDSAADGESSDITSRKKEGVHDMRVATHDRFPFESGHYGTVMGLREIGVAKGSGKDFVNELCRGSAACAVRHVDDSVFDVDRTDISFFCHDSIFLERGFRYAARRDS